MCTKLLDMAFETQLPPVQKAVLIVLANHANAKKGGLAWPAVSTICRHSGYQERAVRKALAELCTNGHITARQITGKPTQYLVHPCTTCTPAPHAPLHKVHPTPAPHAPKPLNEPLVVVSASALPTSARAKPAFVLPDWVPADAWDGFIEMRKRKRANPTDRAKHLLLAKLKRFADAGQPPGDVLDQSTASGWTDIYELKGQANGRSNGSMGRNDRPRGGVVVNAIRELYAEAVAAEEAEAVIGIDGNNRGTGVALQLVSGHRP